MLVIKHIAHLHYIKHIAGTSVTVEYQNLSRWVIFNNAQLSWIWLLLPFEIWAFEKQNTELMSDFGILVYGSYVVYRKQFRSM